MSLFRRKPKRTPAEERTASLEALRVRWEEHVQRLPPDPSADRNMVEFRAWVAEIDVKASRYVGAVLMGHADGLEAPMEEVGGYGERLAALLARHPRSSSEIRFYIGESVEVAKILLEAARLQEGRA